MSGVTRSSGPYCQACFLRSQRDEVDEERAGEDGVGAIDKFLFCNWMQVRGGFGIATYV